MLRAKKGFAVPENAWTFVLLVSLVEDWGVRHARRWFHGEMQGKTTETPRPVLVLNFYGNNTTVAITCANNGFVVGMNFRKWERISKWSRLTIDQSKDLPSHLIDWIF
jgi:hypothetical protein